MITQTLGTNSLAPPVRSATPTTKSFKDLGSEDFFGLLIAQLRNQDPLKPTDNQQLLDQMSSIRQMEQSATLTKTLQTLSVNQKFGETAGMVGKYVFGSVQDSSGAAHEIHGLVVAVRFQRDGRAILDLHNGESLPVDNVEELTLVDNLPPDIRDQIPGASGSTPGGSSGGASGTPAAENPPHPDPLPAPPSAGGRSILEALLS